MNSKASAIKNKTIKILESKYHRLIYGTAYSVHSKYKSIGIEVEDLVNVCLYKLEIAIADFNIERKTNFVAYLKQLCLNFCHNECSKYSTQKHKTLNFAREIKYDTDHQNSLSLIYNSTFDMSELKDFLLEENKVLTELEHYVLTSAFNDETDEWIANNISKSIKQVKRYKQSAIEKVNRYLGYN